MRRNSRVRACERGVVGWVGRTTTRRWLSCAPPWRSSLFGHPPPPRCSSGAPPRAWWYPIPALRCGDGGRGARSATVETRAALGGGRGEFHCNSFFSPFRKSTAVTPRCLAAADAWWKCMGVFGGVAHEHNTWSAAASGPWQVVGRCRRCRVAWRAPATRTGRAP